MYDTIAPVYEWLLPDELVEPEGTVAALAGVLDGLAPRARVLDCAAGGGQLAVGLALRGFDVTASDASAGMLERTRTLAAERDVALRTAVSAWEELGEQGWAGRFDAVFCIGNSLPHARGRSARRAALAGMAGVLREGGLLAVTSRNWEKLRAARRGLDVEDGLVERRGRRAVVVRAWTFADGWDEQHVLEVAVAVLDGDGGVETYVERLPFWPFSADELQGDLGSAGLVLAMSTYEPEAERYLVTARRAAGAGARGGSAPPAA